MVLSVQGYFPPANSLYPLQALFNLMRFPPFQIATDRPGVTDVAVIKGSVVPSLLMAFSFQSHPPPGGAAPFSLHVECLFSEKVSK